MNVIAISSQNRESVGTKSASLSRRAGLIPAVVYGTEVPKHVLVKWGEVRHAVYTPDFNLVNLEVDGKPLKCIIKETQFHPVSDEIIHIDFLAVVEGTPINVEVPVRFKGTSIGVKNGGKLIQSIRKLKIRTTPDKLVDQLMVDISHLDLGHVLRVKNVEVGEGIQIQLNSQIPIANVEIPRALKSAAAADAKTAGKKK